MEADRKIQRGQKTAADEIIAGRRQGAVRETGVGSLSPEPPPVSAAPCPLGKDTLYEIQGKTFYIFEGTRIWNLV